MFYFLIIIFVVLSIIPLAVIILSRTSSFKSYQNHLYLILIILSLVPKIYFFQTQSDNLLGLYDAPGHIDYIKYIVLNLRLPPWYECWECYQPPIYYLTAVASYKYLELTGIISSIHLILFLKLFSFFLFYAFLFTAIAIFRLILRPELALIASSLILFWPSGAIHSSRIGNDLLLYVLLALSLYFLIRWWMNNTYKFLIKSIFLILLGILTKTNALVMLPVTVATYLFHTTFHTTQLKRVIFFMMLLFFSVSLTMIINQRNNLFGNTQANWLVPTWSGIPQHLYVGKGWENFIYFDINTYLKYANVDPGIDEGGRQYFWIYLIKTSLFGDLAIRNSIQQDFAKIISFMMLILLAFMMIGLVTLNRKQLKLYAPLLLSLISSICSIIIYRIYFPCSCTNDFRFIYPALIPILTLIVLSANFFSRSRILRVFFIFQIACFISLSFLFHLIPGIFP